MPRSPSIFVAGHRGLVGSAVVRELEMRGFGEVVTRTSAELDLTRQADTESFFRRQRPEVVVLAAAKVGGIKANSDFPADFIFDNLAIELNVIDAARRNGCRRLVFLGSSCIYPRLAPQPIREEYLLGGPLEPTNEPYAVAKIAGIKMCQALRRQHGFDAVSLMPTNLYGPDDNFDASTSHVLPALIRRFEEARRAGLTEVAVWGTGKPRREFLYVDDLAAAVCDVIAMDAEVLDAIAPERIINVGTGEDLSIAALAQMVATTVGYSGAIRFDPSKPDGTPRKVLDVSRIRSAGWQPRVGLTEGIRWTLEWFRESAASETHSQFA